MHSKRKAEEKAKSKKAEVAILMGSESDLPIMGEAARALRELKVPFYVAVTSAHRSPHETIRFAEGARKKGFKVIIAGAGGAAHLPGVIAAVTELPVIGVPIPHGPLAGKDALYSIVQMPKGVPVATVAIGNAWNAGILAAQILGASDPDCLDRIAKYKKTLSKKLLEKKIR